MTVGMKALAWGAVVTCPNTLAGWAAMVCGAPRCFGSLSTQQREWLVRATSEDLADWSIRLFVAESLDKIFNG